MREHYFRVIHPAGYLPQNYGIYREIVNFLFKPFGTEVADEGIAT